MEAEIATNEAQRLAALFRYRVLDTPPEAAFDRLARTAAQVFGTPMAAVSLVAEHRQFLKSSIGWEARETPRDLAFCAHTILQDAPLIVPDALQDPRFCANGLVTGEPGIRFYAGAPLISKDGFRVGSLCVIDTIVHDVPNQRRVMILRELAAEVVEQFEFRLARRELERFAVALEQEEARRKIEECELRRAKEAAEAANRAKDLFLANVSHELRTPLNGVLGMAALLQGTLLNVDQREFADVIQESGQTLLRVIDDILDLSRIEAGTFRICAAEFNLRLTIGKTISFIRSGAKAKGLDLFAELDPDLPALVHGDATRLHQVLTVFLTNAVKFTERGSVRVRASLGSLENSRAVILLEVQDTGCGIPKPLQRKLFQSFTQLDDSSRRKHGGVGLGLAIAKRIAELMGGTVGVESDPHCGSTFWFRLPLGLAQEAGNQDAVYGQEHGDTLVPGYG